MPDELLTIPEAAKHCGVSTRTIYRWLDRGLRPYYPVPALKESARIARADLDAFKRPTHVMPPFSAAAHARGGETRKSRLTECQTSTKSERLDDATSDDG